MKPIGSNSNSKAHRNHGVRLLMISMAAAILVIACGGETAELEGTMEPADTELETMAETSAESPVETPETRMDGPPTSAEETMPRDNVQESGEDDEPEMTAGEALPGSGVPVWEEGAVGALVPGLDGAAYDAYAPEVIGEVQQALAGEGIYTGPINHVLDEPTMNAIGEFQEANDIQVTGVPSPMTRERLLEDNS